MNKYIVIIIIGLSLITAFSGCVGVDYIILGDTVYYGNTNFNMSVSPHTLYDSGYVDFSFILYNEAFNNTLIDGFWLFNTSQSYPSSTNYSGEFIHKSISWEGWTDLYAVKNVLVKTNKYYNISAFINIAFDTSGKYCFGVKKSSVSWSDAWANGEGNPNGFFWIDPWWNSNFDYRKSIILNSSQIPSNEVNFPVYINITDADLSSNAQADGDDICFLSDDLTVKYNHEIVRYETVTGLLEAWVNITVLPDDADTRIWMYYGNADCVDQSNTSGTWDSDYLIVYHMNDVDNGLTDSSRYGNDAIEDATDPPDNDDYLQTGICGYAVKYDGGGNFDNSQHHEISNRITTNQYFEDGFTVEFWCYYVDLDNNIVHYPITISNENHAFFGHRDIGVNDERNYFYSRDDTLTANLLFGSALNIDTWYYQSSRFVDSVGNEKNLYLDSVADGVDDELSLYDNQRTDNIGADHGDDWGMDGGMVDEVRISNNTRSYNWLITSYNTIINGSDGGFFSVGSQIGNSLPVVSNANPLNNSYDNNLGMTWKCTIEDDHTNFNWTMECSNGNTSSGNNETNGTKNLIIDGLDTDTEYFVYVNVTEYYGRSIYYWFNFTTIEVCRCLITNPFPVNSSVDVNFTYVNMTIDINSSCGIADFVNISLVCVSCSTLNYTNFTSVYNGTYFLNISDLNSFSSYIWYVNTSCNGTHNYTFFIFTTKLSGGGCDCDDIRVIMRQELNNYNAFKESDDMNIGFEMDIIGLLAVIIFYLLLVYRKDFVFGIFCSVISLSVGLFYLGNTVFSIYWWLGVILFLVCLYSSFLSVYYALSGKYFDTLNK